MTASSGSHRAGSRYWAQRGAAAVVVAVTSLAVALAASGPAAAPARNADSDAVATVASAVAGAGANSALERPAAPSAAGLAPSRAIGVAPPLRIAIPDLGISNTLIGLRVDRDGVLATPADFRDVGWWSSGPAPGERGGAVFVGHVSWNGRPGVFAGLGGLKDGAAIVIDRSDGSIATYRVRARRQVDKDDFPDNLVYTFTGPTTLHLLTCGGDIDPRTGQFRDNLVVFAELVSDTGAMAPR